MLMSNHRTCMKNLQYADPYVFFADEYPDIFSQQPQDYSVESSKFCPTPQCRRRHVFYVLS